MIRSQLSTLAPQPVRYSAARAPGTELILSERAHCRSGNWNCPAAVVASSDKDILCKLAEIVAHSGLATFVASTIGQTKTILNCQKVCLVVCDEHLTDGAYGDLLNQTVSLRLNVPVIVVSRTGDWPEYLKAVSVGAFDYLAYPPDPEDLRRVLHHASTAPRINDSDVVLTQSRDTGEQR